MNDINTVNDWMIAVAEALEAQDIEDLEELNRISEGWLQGREEREAQETLIRVVMDAVYCMED